MLPSTQEAVEQYNLAGGRIFETCAFGTDPVEMKDELKQIRYESFTSKYSFEILFCEVSNGCGDTFKNALLFLIDITYRLSHS